MSKEIIIRENGKEIVMIADEKQAEFVYDLLTFLSNDSNKGDAMKLAYAGDTSNVDSALDINTIRDIQDMYEGFATINHVMDYKNNSFGKIVNLPEKILQRGAEILNIDYKS